jgi:hypothetical protein
MRKMRKIVRNEKRTEDRPEAEIEIEAIGDGTMMIANLIAERTKIVNEVVVVNEVIAIEKGIAAVIVLGRAKTAEAAEIVIVEEIVIEIVSVAEDIAVPVVTQENEMLRQHVQQRHHLQWSQEL